MDKRELQKAVDLIIEFLDSRASGESYWTDEEGRDHDADIGYVSEFLDDLKSYCDGTWESKNLRYARNPVFKYIVRWKWRRGEYG